MKVLALLSIFLALPLAAQTAQCDKGEYRSVDGRCLHDQTGESHPSGDGCNSDTCMDAACRNVTRTAMYCVHGDDPAYASPATGILSGVAAPVTSGSVIGFSSTGQVQSYPDMEAVKKACHQTLWRRLRGYREPEWCK